VVAAVPAGLEDREARPLEQLDAEELRGQVGARRVGGDVGRRARRGQEDRR
jgi:hypothetical protein